MNSMHIYETVCHMTNARDLKVTYLRNLNFRNDFCRLMKNIIFNKTKSFVGRNTSNHTCQIFCSKSNCETMYQ